MENLGMIDRNFWCGKRVFVTGHTGFKGSWLCQWLILLGAEVCGYSLNAPTAPNLFSVLGLERETEHLTGDVRDFESLKVAIEKYRPEIVFHLAAQSIVRISYQEPRRTYETNVMGTLNLYEAVRACDSVKVIVSITTDKCYENKEWIWGYRENDPMGGYDPYSSSKGCVEILSAAYRRSYFNPEQYGKTHCVALATARAGNVIGGGDWAVDRLLPDCARSLAQQKTISIRSPRSTRPWQHVLDPLAGYLCLAQKMYIDGISYSEGWNFGPGEDGVLDVENVVKYAVAFWGSGEYYITPDADYHEAQLLKLDPSKARAKLGWATKIPVRDAIRSTIEWYKAFYSNEDAKRVLLAQINKFDQQGL